MVDKSILENKDILDFLEYFDEEALEMPVSAFEIGKLISCYDDEYSDNDDDKEDQATELRKFIDKLRIARDSGLNILVIYDR